MTFTADAVALMSMGLLFILAPFIVLYVFFFRLAGWKFATMACLYGLAFAALVGCGVMFFFLP